MRQSDPPLLRRGIGYVIQQAGLFPHRTVLDNVATVPVLAGWSRAKAAQAGPRSCWRRSACRPAWPAATRPSCPAASSSGSAWRGRWRSDPPVLLMDEPFSAVDPIVREGLQDELLRLQAELAKTIVFVTHDIDEAIKLGDKVAVFRTGGILAQYDKPAALLARPADDFVRQLRRPRPRLPGAGLPAAAGLTIGELVQRAARRHRRRRAAETARRLGRRGGRAHGTRCGWLSADRLSRVDESATVDEDLVMSRRIPTGDDTGSSGSLRSALDSALSSPAALGVAVDGSGALRRLGQRRRGARGRWPTRAPPARSRNDVGVRRTWGCSATSR